MGAGEISGLVARSWVGAGRCWFLEEEDYYRLSSDRLRLASRSPSGDGINHPLQGKRSLGTACRRWGRRGFVRRVAGVWLQLCMHVSSASLPRVSCVSTLLDRSPGPLFFFMRPMLRTAVPLCSTMTSSGPAASSPFTRAVVSAMRKMYVLSSSSLRFRQDS